MARPRRSQTTEPSGGVMWRAALYARLSREDGDKLESDSIFNQKKLLEDYLSRFGRDYIDVGRYLERWFPERGVRFVAIGDNIDSEKGPCDMRLPVKNIINKQYARDISQKL